MTIEGRAAAGILRALPHQPTRFIGREAEMRAVANLLEDSRLVSLTGPPGSGKTRLAVEVARTAAAGFSDGVWFVPLAPLQDPEMIPAAVGEVLDVKEEATAPRSEVIERHLAARNLLLVLDNFEHVLEGSQVVASWLAASPRVRVLTTTRAALHLAEEHEFPVPPLSVPADPDHPRAAETEAVQLFGERARAVVPDFSVEDALPDVARICRRLDGLPLALELAAARTKVLPPKAILARLEHSLDLLTGAPRDRPERHRSLHAAIAWSYGLLTTQEQVFLRRLAVFRGGWELEAAGVVTGADDELGADVLELTASLLDKSLIRRDPGARSEARYEMLETLREYGAERMAAEGETDATEERHVRWYLDLAERAAPFLTGPDQGTWLDRLERESDNLRAALRCTIDCGAAELGMRLAAALWRFWQIRGHLAEGRAFLQELLGLDAEVDPRVRAHALSAAGSLAYWQSDQHAAVALYESAVDMLRTLGDPAELASGLYDLGHSVSVLGPLLDSPRGRALETEALEIYRALGDPLGVARLTWGLGVNAYMGGDDETAVVELGQSVELFRGLDDRFGLAWALNMHALAASRFRQLELAGSSWREAVTIFAGVDDVSGVDTVLHNLAWLAGELGHLVRSARLGGAAARIRGVSQISVTDAVHRPSGSPEPEQDPDRPSPEELEAAWREGEAMSTAEAVAYALRADGEDAEASKAAAGPHGLRVYALGSMRVERDGQSIRSWGGEKAGSRQAQAIFAFLFDRGETGVTKDEVTELLWPDLEIRRGDLAFHRTLGGLRSVLAGDRDDDHAIVYDAGRYRLAADVVGWSDVAEFERLLDRQRSPDGREAVSSLERARELYRGDLFDDCPFYGDSSFVEERRGYLRGRYEDLLVELGDRLADGGDAATATARYREALVLDPDSARASAGIKRLGDPLRPEARS